VRHAPKRNLNGVCIWMSSSTRRAASVRARPASPLRWRGVRSRSLFAMHRSNSPLRADLSGLPEQGNLRWKVPHRPRSRFRATGVVFAATHLRLGERVAIKMLLPEWRDEPCSPSALRARGARVLRSVASTASASSTSTSATGGRTSSSSTWREGPSRAGRGARNTVRRQRDRLRTSGLRSDRGAHVLGHSP